MSGKPLSMLTGLENMANLVKQTNNMTVEKINNIGQATSFIKDNDTKIANAWFNLAHALKKVRDEKLYEGQYLDFEDYYMNELKYAKTMVYNFIKVAENFPLNTKEEVVGFGVTKLISLSELGEEKREEFLEDNDVSNMTVKDIKMNIKQSNKPYTPTNDGTDINFTLDEFDKVKDIYKNINRFNMMIGEMAEKTSQEELIDYNKIYVLHEKCIKAKKEIRQMEKMIKKYL